MGETSLINPESTPGRMKGFCLNMSQQTDRKKEGNKDRNTYKNKRIDTEIKRHRQKLTEENIDRQMDPEKWI